jgi:DNA polymerase III delta prime subunit
MKADKHVLWVEKYRPSSLDEYIFHDESHKKAFQQMVENKTIPHLLLSGVQGSGKTTIAQILIKELGVDPTDVLLINASDENSVDFMRDKIKSFITTFAMGEFKVIQLEEADYLTINAQAVLRKYMEDPNCPARFILTCNYENKIMPAIKSRSQQFRFKSGDRDEITEYAARILLTEKVKFGIDLLDKYIAVGYPDIRKIINLLQQNSISGILQPLISKSESGDYKFKLLDLLNIDDWTGARTLACGNVATEEWEDLYRFLYENLDKSKKFSKKDNWEAGIVIITDHLYKNAVIADQEINAAAMFIRLSQV